MKNRQGAPAPWLLQASQPTLRLFHRLFFILAATVLLGGCASPGEPIERKPPVPLAVTDLAAVQSGNSVVLTFTLPQQTVDGRPLDQSPAIEIYRDFESAPAVVATPAHEHPVPAHPSLLVTIPSALVDRYADQGRVRYPDALKAEDFVQHPNGLAVYMVRARASTKKESADSNSAALRIHPAPDSIVDLQATGTSSGVQLNWTPPQTTPAGSAPPIFVYRIYRAVSPPGAVPSGANAVRKSGEPSARNAGNIPPALPLTKIAETESPAYLDTQTRFGDAYVYSVRSVVRYPGETLESADSNLVALVARDTFPPSPPQGLIVVFVPTQGDVAAHFDLSWAISSETDVAGYNVYRSEQVGVLGTRLNTEMLPTPAFRDMNVQPGQRYFYRVTAVDRSGNESPAGPAVPSAAQAESKPTP